MPNSIASGRLTNKVAVITGAARGIGRAVSVAFAREGASIVGIDICAPVDPRSGVKPSSREDLEETGRLVEAEGQRWLGIVAGQRNIAALRVAGLQAEKQFGGIEILFTNPTEIFLIGTNPVNMHCLQCPSIKITARYTISQAH